jgi:hypothetical protein
MFKFATWYPSPVHIFHLRIWRGNILGIFLTGMFSTPVSCCPQCTSFFKNWLSWSDSSLQIAINQVGKMRIHVMRLSKQDHYLCNENNISEPGCVSVISSMGGGGLLSYSWTNPVSWMSCFEGWKCWMNIVWNIVVFIFTRHHKPLKSDCIIQYQALGREIYQKEEFLNYFWSWPYTCW